MEALKETFNIVVKKPFIILFFALVTLICLGVNSVNPIMPILFGLSTITKGDIFGSIVSYLQVILDPGMIGLVLLFIIGVSIAASLVMGLAFSGYINVVNNALYAHQETKDAFFSGVRKYFLKVSLISLRFICLSAIFTIFMSVVTVPAIVITRTAITATPKFFAAAVFVDVLTACIMFLGTMFFRAYMLFWYPAAAVTEKKAFLMGKQVADDNFWRIVGSFTLFDLIFLLFQLLFFMIRIQFIGFISRWIFDTLFFTIFATFIFSAFKVYRNNIVPSDDNSEGSIHVTQ